MRSGRLIALLFVLTLSVGACQLLWSYDEFHDKPSTTSSSSSFSSSSSSSSGSAGGGGSSGSDAGDGGCVDAGMPCDCDGDGFLSWECLDAGDPMADCADQDPRANPKAFFQTTPILPPMRPGLDPWDFNCDGKVNRQYGGPIQCPGFSIPSGCTPGPQYVMDAPDCGVTGVFAVCVPDGIGCAGQMEGELAQGCR
jgi:hypothetical protein